MTWFTWHWNSRWETHVPINIWLRRRKCRFDQCDLRNSSFLFVLVENCSYNEITHPIKITKNPFWGQMIDSFISLVLSYRIIDIVWYHWFSQKSVFLNVLAVINVDYVKIGSWKRDRSGSFYLFDVKTDLWTQNNSTQFSQIETTDGYASKL